MPNMQNGKMSNLKGGNAPVTMARLFDEFKLDLQLFATPVQANY